MALDKIGSKELATNKTQSKAITCMNKLIDKNQHNVDTHRDQQYQGQMGQDCTPKFGNISAFHHWANEQYAHGFGSSPNPAPATVNVQSANRAPASQSQDVHYWASHT